MRKGWSALLGVSVLCLAVIHGGWVLAGDYHSGATLVCSDCHNMHFSQTHGYNPDGSGITTPLGPSGPYSYLLRHEINALCLTCHNLQAFAPDVYRGGTGPDVRQAGGLHRASDAGAPYFASTGHTLEATGTATGGTWSPDPILGLVCTDCHDPHGDGGPTPNPYRNLSPVAGGTTGTVPDYNDVEGVQDPTRDVFERFFASYDVGDVDFMEPDTSASGYADWCKRCHTDFHGPVGGSEIGGSGSPPVNFDRHPTAGVDIGDAGGNHSSADTFGNAGKQSWVKVMTSTGIWQPALGAEVTDHTPSCFTCHKGHGNQNAFGLIQMDPNDPVVTEEGSAGGTYKDLCAQCHTQG